MDKKKKLMLLGGTRYLLPVIKAAHEQGYYVITADYLPDNIAHKYSDEYANVSIIDKDAVLKAAQERQIDNAIEARQKVAVRYREALRDVPGIRFFDDMPGVKHNYSYFPVFVNAEEYGTTRDELYFKMKEQGVLGRRYFYPLISTFSTYRGLPSATPENLPMATKMANEVICLPMHHALSDTDVQRVLELIAK